MSRQRLHRLCRQRDKFPCLDNCWLALLSKHSSCFRVVSAFSNDCKSLRTHRAECMCPALDRKPVDRTFLTF